MSCCWEWVNTEHWSSPTKGRGSFYRVSREDATGKPLWHLSFFHSVEQAGPGDQPVLCPGPLTGAQWGKGVCYILYLVPTGPPDTGLSLYHIHFLRPFGNGKFLEEWPNTSYNLNCFPPLELLGFHALHPRWVRWALEWSVWWTVWRHVALPSRISPSPGVLEHIRISMHESLSVFLNPQMAVMHSRWRNTAQPFLDLSLYLHATPLPLNSILPNNSPWELSLSAGKTRKSSNHPSSLGQNKSDLPCLVFKHSSGNSSYFYFILLSGSRMNNKENWYLLFSFSRPMVLTVWSPDQ